MSKAVLISIRPEWCKKIVSGRKTLELRKSEPALPAPFKCYIYETKGKKQYYSQPMPIPCYEGHGKVIGEFVCDGVLGHCEMANADIAEMQSLVRREKILEYAGKKEVFGWHISDLVIYDKPKELGEFVQMCSARRVQRPPQCWCYVKELTEGGAGNG